MDPLVEMALRRLDFTVSQADHDLLLRRWAACGDAEFVASSTTAFARDVTVWFPSGKPRAGIGAALLALSESDSDGAERPLFERALRHAEIRRQRAFDVGAAGSERTLERLRVCRAFALAARRWGDARFINAGLSLLDAEHLMLRRMRVHEADERLQAAYVAAVAEIRKRLDDLA